jgi:hypothetical protein
VRFFINIIIIPLAFSPYLRIAKPKHLQKSVKKTLTADKLKIPTVTSSTSSVSPSAARSDGLPKATGRAAVPRLGILAQSDSAAPSAKGGLTGIRQQAERFIFLLVPIFSVFRFFVCVCLFLSLFRCSFVCVSLFVRVCLF